MTKLYNQDKWVSMGVNPTFSGLLPCNFVRFARGIAKIKIFRKIKRAFRLEKALLIARG
jgi:hypothetical protein